MAKKEPYKDWIVRYYGSHDDIPPGHTDGELTELIRCKDCKYWMPRQICLAYDTPQNYCEKHMPDDDFYAEIWNSNDFCSEAERKEHGE